MVKISVLHVIKKTPFDLYQFPLFIIKCSTFYLFFAAPFIFIINIFALIVSSTLTIPRRSGPDIFYEKPAVETFPNFKGKHKQ